MNDKEYLSCLITILFHTNFLLGQLHLKLTTKLEQLNYRIIVSQKKNTF